MNRWIAGGLVLALSLSGCSKNDKQYRPKTQELRFNLHSDPPTLDPRKATDTISISPMKLCFEGLTRIDLQGHPILAAAEKVEISLDQKRYTFTLREALWSDGKPVTALDFEKTWKTVLDPTFPSENAIDLFILKNARAAKMQRCPLDWVGVKALDDRTLQIDLEHPVPYFMSALATHTFFAVPTHITSTYPDWTHGHYVSNGTFVLKEWRHHDALVLEKNQNYWDKDNVKLEKVQLMLIEDSSTELSMYENGELDWAGYPLSNLPADAIAALNKTGKLHQYRIAGTYYYVFNTKEFPFTNAHIRRAFALAIDRQAIVSNITQAGQIPATSFVPSTMWKDPSSYFKDHDVVEAKRLLALGLQELGITIEELPPITLSYNTLIDHHKIAQAIQQQWQQALGIRVHLANKEWKVFLDELRQHKFQVARLGGIANINDPINFLDYYRFMSSSNNHSQWSNPKFSELLEQADETADAEQRMSLLRAAEKLLIQDMPIAPIYFYSGVYLKKPYVRGIYLSELNDLDLKWAYVELNDQVSQ